MPESSAEILAIYKLNRDYIKHEDQLTSDRISRTLLVHGFLIASYALLLQSRIGAMAQCQSRDAGCVPRSAAVLANPEKFGKPSLEAVKALMPPDQLIGFLSLADVILLVIALIGLLTTFAALWGVRAAALSIDEIKARWERESIPYLNSLNGSALQIALPPLTGGGASQVDGVWRYRNSTTNFLRVLLLMWWIIVAISAFELVSWSKDYILAWIDPAPR